MLLCRILIILTIIMVFFGCATTEYNGSVTELKTPVLLEKKPYKVHSVWVCDAFERLPNSSKKTTTKLFCDIELDREPYGFLETIHCTEIDENDNLTESQVSMVTSTEGDILEVKGELPDNDFAEIIKQFKTLPDKIHVYTGSILMHHDISSAFQPAMGDSNKNILLIEKVKGISLYKGRKVIVTDYTLDASPSFPLPQGCRAKFIVDGYRLIDKETTAVIAGNGTFALVLTDPYSNEYGRVGVRFTQNPKFD